MAPRAKNVEQNDPTTGNGWRPEAGDQVIGVLVDGAVSQGSGYGEYMVLTLRTDDGRRVDVHCFHEVLERRLIDLRPRTGERMRITYHGQKRSADGRRTISLYTVEVAGRGVDPVAALLARRSAAPVQTPAPQAVIETPPAQAEFPPTPPAPADDDIPF